MKMFLFVLLEGGFYDFVAYFLGVFLFDYCGVHVWLLQGIDFSENSGFSGCTAYDGCCLWLFKNV